GISVPRGNGKSYAGAVVGLWRQHWPMTGVHASTPPKGGFGRDVDLSNEPIRVLRTQLLKRKAEKLRRGWADLPAFFPSTAGTSADPSGVRQAFRKVRTQAGLPAHFSPHSLRHTYAALHLQAGTDVYYVSRMLGHSDITLTVHTYGAWLQPDRRASVDALDRA